MTFSRGDLLSQRAGDSGHARAHFDDHGVRAQACQHAVWAIEHGLNDRAGGQDGDDDVGRRSQRTIGSRNRATDLFAKGLGAFGRSVNNLKGVAGFVQ